VLIAHARALQLGIMAMTMRRAAWLAVSIVVSLFGIGYAALLALVGYGVLAFGGRAAFFTLLFLALALLIVSAVILVWQGYARRSLARTMIGWGLALSPPAFVVVFNLMTGVV
jgi:hypothetical protein